MAVHTVTVVTEDGVYFYGNVGNPPRIDGYLLDELPDDWEPSPEHKGCFSTNNHLLDRRKPKD